MRQCQARLRESEAVWQEDLNKWKTRRKSLNSDLHKKNAREQLKPSTSGTVHVGDEEQQRSLEREEPDLASVAPDETFMQPSPSRSSSSAPDTQATSEAIQRTVSLNSTSSDHMQSSSSPSLPATASDSVPAPVQCARSSEGVVSEAPQMSAVLPRGLRRSEGTSRLSTGVTPKPFSIKTAGRLTQPRFYSMDDFQNSQREHQLPTSFPHQGSDTTSGYKDDLHSGAHEAIQESKGETSGKRIDSAPTIHSFMSASILMPDKVGHHDMKVSLCQTPDGGKDFGFQAYWDSTGTCIKSVQPGSPAQLCHLRAGDEIVALGGQRVAEMSYEQWKANMDAALREGKLLMEIRRLGLNGDPDHQESISTTSTLPENEAKMQVNGHPVNANGLSLKAVSGLLPDNQFPRKTKEQDIIVMQNHNRRLDFFKQKGSSSGSTVDSSVYLCGGSDSAISDLQVPSIGVSSSRWSWNAEEERRRQEKWQMEQEHLLQEKYRRDQERLEEAWRRDQQEAALEESLCLEKQELPSLPSGNRTHYTPPPVLQQAKSPTSVAPPPQTKEATLTQKKPVQVLAGHPSKEACDSSTETSQWPSESYGFSPITASFRKKSKSSSSLEGRPKQDSRGIKKKSRVSQAEQERLQILEEMRKKTPVLTDSSWIRQHSTSTIHKGPINMEPIKRHESLDNIHSASDNTISNSSLSKHFSSSSFPLSGLSGIVPYRGYSGRCSLGPGAAIFSNALKQNSWSQPTSVSPVSDPEEACNRTQQHDSVSAAGLSSGKTQNQEPRCESDTDSSSATPVTTDSESILAFPSDRSASWNIGEKRFPEEDSNTVNTSSAQRNV